MMVKTPDRWTFERTDGLALSILLALVVLVYTLFSLVLPLNDWIKGNQLIVPYESKVTVPALDALGLEYSRGTYVLYLDHPSTTQRLLDLTPWLLSWCGVVLATWLVLQIMRPIMAGDPFAAGQVTRLRLLAALIYLGPTLVVFIASLCRLSILGPVDLGGLPLSASAELPWATILTGLVLALLAEAFREGARLRDDTEGLI